MNWHGISCCLLNDPDMSERIGVNARKHVEDNFSMDVTVRETMRVYNAVSSLSLTQGTNE